MGPLGSHPEPVSRGVGGRLRDSARSLFLAHGYPAVTTKQIAAAAGVSERTLFNHYPAKADLLRAAVIEAIVSGTEGPTSTNRADFQRAMSQENPAAQIAAFAKAVTRLHTEVAPLAAVCRRAAAVDPAAADFWAFGSAQQRADCETFVGRVKNSPRGGKARKLAVDAVTALSSHELYWQLVVDFSWSRPTYQRWLQRHLETVLLTADPR